MSSLQGCSFLCRETHQDFVDISSVGGPGVYFIGCEDRVVYIGQSSTIAHRSIASLVNVYYQTYHLHGLWEPLDANRLSWAIGLSVVRREDEINLDELESTAIKKFAPIFNFSIPRKLKSEGKEPKITHIAQVFADQNKNCNAFELENLEKQAREAENNPSPP